MSTLSFDEFVRLVSATLPSEDIRYGQHWFNVLNAVRPDLADRLRGSLLDPFHRDSVSEQTSAFVATAW